MNLEDMIRSNFHTHTNYCDGKNTPFEMAEEAYKKGAVSLGFSSHSYINEKELFWTLSPQKEALYRADVEKVKELYEGKMEVLLGIEQDVLSTYKEGEYEYVIGSVHAIERNGILLPVDYSAAMTKKIVEEVYNGKFDDYARDYYKLVMEIPNRMKPDIIGHIDVISKFADKLDYRLTDSYYEYATMAVDKLSKCGAPFEINTGAMARGYRKTPYPSVRLLRRIKENGGEVIYSSDCHEKDGILFGFIEALELIRSVGFKRVCRLSKDGYLFEDFD